MKKIIAILLLISVSLSLAACDLGVDAFLDEDTEERTMTAEEFEQLLTTLPLIVSSTEYVKKDISLENPTEEMLRVILQNNSEYDIKNAVVSFTAWDANDLPVKIKSAEDYTAGAYVRQVSFADINLLPGAAYGEQGGYEIDEECYIASFKAVVLSFETFDGKVWKNPYYDEWCDLYEGTKITESMSVLVKVENEDSINIDSFTTTGNGEGYDTVTPNDTQGSAVTPPADGSDGFTVLNFGDSISLDFVEMTVNGASYSDELYPTDLNGEYLYLQDVENEKFFYLSGTLKNIGTGEYSAGEAKAEITFDGEHKYEAQVIVDQGQSFTGTNIKLLYSVKIYICASVPDEMIDTYETCSIRFAFDDNFKSQSGYGLEDFPHKYEVNVEK